MSHHNRSLHPYSPLITPVVHPLHSLVTYSAPYVTGVNGGERGLRGRDDSDPRIHPAYRSHPWWASSPLSRPLPPNNPSTSRVITRGVPEGETTSEWKGMCEGLWWVRKPHFLSLVTGLPSLTHPLTSLLIRHIHSLRFPLHSFRSGTRSVT